MTVTLDNDGRLRLQIDPLRLDEEWLGQPQIFYNQAEKAAKAQFDYDEAVSELKRTKAELDRRVRDNPEEHGISKLTETIVEQTVVAQIEYQAADKQVNKTRFRLNIENGAVEALQQRKRALTMLVELWIREYYADRAMKSNTEPTSNLEKEAVRNRGRRRLESVEGDKKEDSDG